MRQVGLGDWLDTLPAGLATVLAGGAAAVSAGQRRRLLLARVLLCPAPIVLLDEPTEHLDAADGHRLLADLLDRTSPLLGSARTVVVATHEPGDHLDCPRLVGIDNPVGAGRPGGRRVVSESDDGGGLVVVAYHGLS